MAEKKVKKKETKMTKPETEKIEMQKRSILRRKKVEEEKKAEVKELQPVQKIDPFAIIKFVVMTERAIQIIEKQNKLVFVVDRSAKKNDIKKAAESAFSTNVSNVQTMIDQLGRKKAFVKFTKEGEAGEIAIRLGII